MGWVTPQRLSIELAWPACAVVGKYAPRIVRTRCKGKIPQRIRKIRAAKLFSGSTRPKTVNHRLRITADSDRDSGAPQNGRRRARSKGRWSG